MEKAAIELFDAMLLSVTLFAYPIRLLMIIIFAKLAKRSIRYKFEDILDIVISALVFIWIQHYYENSSPSIH